MKKTCTYNQDANNHSALPEHAADRCGQRAAFRYGHPENKTEFFLCEEHAALIRNASPWGHGLVRPLAALTT